MIGARQTYLYFEGTPLFPFGHGLSYAEFAYGNLVTHMGDGELTVSFDVTNTGAVTADEVAQLYVRAEDPSVPRPRRELAGHRRVTLAPGASTELTFRLPLSVLEFWDVAHGTWHLEPGAYELLAGASSEDIRLRTTVTVEGEPVTPRPVVTHGLNAADFDEQRGTAIVDRAKVSGDAVVPAGGAPGEPEGSGGPGELLFRRCDFGAGVTEMTVEVAGEGSVEFSLVGGPVLATLTLGTPTADSYTYTTLRAAVSAAGVHDVHLSLRGPLRLAHVGFSG